MPMEGRTEGRMREKVPVNVGLTLFLTTIPLIRPSHPRSFFPSSSPSIASSSPPYPSPQLAQSFRDIGLESLSQACVSLPRSLALAVLSCFDAFKRRLDDCLVEHSAGKGGQAGAGGDATPRASGMLR